MGPIIPRLRCTSRRCWRYVGKWGVEAAHDRKIRGSDAARLSSPPNISSLSALSRTTLETPSQRWLFGSPCSALKSRCMRLISTCPHRNLTIVSPQVATQLILNMSEAFCDDMANHQSRPCTRPFSALACMQLQGWYPCRRTWDFRYE